MAEQQSIVYSLFLIFTGAALLATLALYTRQALIIGYILLGAAFGPWGLAWVADTSLIADISQVGIIFLLFLLGLTLSPKKLALLLGQTTLVILITSVVLCGAGWIIARTSGFTATESLLVGVTAMFSSTIIGIKLLPTNILHHRHTGEVIIYVLLLQDLIAIIVMLVWHGVDTAEGKVISHVVRDIGFLLLTLPALIALAYVLQGYVLLRLFRKFDQVQEFVFLLTLAWCLGIAQLSDSLGLSYEIGAFIAGITVAASHAGPFRTARIAG